MSRSTSSLVLSHLFELTFSFDDIDWEKYCEEMPKTVRFTMNPSICLEISEEELLDQVNYDKKVTKVSLGGQQVPQSVH